MLFEYMKQRHMWTDYAQNMNHLVKIVCYGWMNKDKTARCRVLRKVLQPNTEGSHCLVQLCDRPFGDAEALRLLLDSGMDFNCSDDSDGSTPLHSACGRGHPAMVRLLLEAGADVTARDSRGATPMDRALLFSEHSPRPFVGVFGLLLMYGSPLGRRPMTAAKIDARPGLRQVLDEYVSKTDLDKWLAMQEQDSEW